MIIVTDGCGGSVANGDDLVKEQLSRVHPEIG